MRMNERVKGLWLKALRSGEFQQTTELLRDDNGYCCLGVLCEVAHREGMVDAEAGPMTDGGTRWIYGGCWEALPESVMEWAGILSPTGELPDPVPSPDGRSHDLTLADLNDGGWYSFADIADIIDEQF